MVQGRARGLLTPLSVDFSGGMPEGQQDRDWYELGEPRECWLDEMDYIQMRQDPPFDMRYIYATYALEAAQRGGALVVNDPAAVRSHNEKYSLARFAEWAPPFEVSSCSQRLRAFVAEQGDAIVKPLDGMGGRAIYRLRPDDANLEAILEQSTEDGTMPVMAQRYLPEIAQGDKRVYLVHGQVASHMLVRIPQGEDGRGNLVRGAKGECRPVTGVERAIGEALGPPLLAQGLYLVGLDVIGDRLSEVNVTSPTGMREILAQGGPDIAALLWGGLQALREGRG